MGKIRPFRALQFDTAKAGNISALVAPPYDVISREKREALLARSPFNMIRLILGEPSVCPADPKRYAKAERTLRDWRKQGILFQDGEPSLYATEERFKWHGKTLTRRGLICTVRLGDAAVLPHERTLALPAEDRLKLLEAAKTHLSPVYMICDDRDHRFRKLLKREMRRPPGRSFTNKDEPIRHNVWRIADRDVIRKFEKALSPESFLIADGHHRYATALRYAEGKGKNLKEVQWMLAYLTPAPDPGVVLSAIHRIFSTPVTAEELLGRISGDARIREIDASWETFLRSKAPLALLAPGGRKAFAVTPGRSVLARLDRKLAHVPSVILNDWIVRKELNLDLSDAGDQKKTTYIKEPRELISALREKKGLGFWLRPLSVADVFGVAGAGRTLPQKSTFFYPKVTSGLVFHPLN